MATDGDFYMATDSPKKRQVRTKTFQGLSLLLGADMEKALSICKEKGIPRLGHAFPVRKPTTLISRSSPYWAAAAPPPPTSTRWMEEKRTRRAK